MRDSARSVLVDGDGGDTDQGMRLGFAMQSGDDAGTQATSRRDRLRDPGLSRMPDGAAVLVVMQGPVPCRPCCGGPLSGQASAQGYVAAAAQTGAAVSHRDRADLQYPSLS